MTDERTHSSAAAARRRTVSVGITIWQVYEHLPLYDRRSQPSLVFVSETAMRRIRDFPAQWWELPDDALMAVSWRR